MPDAKPQPAGFGNCGRCAYRSTGTAAICYACATATFEDLAANRCDVCERQLKEDGTCGNPICGWDEDERGFLWIWAISMRTGALKTAIDRYKVSGKIGWAWIFGRVLAGHLRDEAKIFDTYDLIIPSPTFMGDGRRDFDHTAEIVRSAQVEDNSWPFRFDVIEKTAATTQFRGRSWHQRRRIASDELRPALAVRRPDLVEGKRVLVVDDVFTEGFTIREVALALKGAGAIEVSEVVLARQPYGGPG